MLAVSRQDADPASPLNGFRRFLRWRHDQPALRWGEIRFISLSEPLLAFTRCLGGQTRLAVFNLSHKDERTRLPVLSRAQPLEEHGLPPARIDGEALHLPAYGALFASVD